MLPFIVPTSVAPITLGSTLLPFGQTTTTVAGLISIGITSAGNLNWSNDLYQYRDAAGILAQRNGANAQSFRVYNAFTDAANYSRAVFGFTDTANVLTIGTQNAGSFATARSIQIVQGGVRVLGHPNGGADTTSWASGPNALALQNANTLNNNASGSYALYSNITGGYNIAIGSSALYSNITGYYNIAIGYQSLLLATAAYYNVAIGSTALRSNTTGENNTAIGFSALYNNTEGSFNMALGGNAIVANTKGVKNTAIGSNALLDLNITVTNTGANTAVGYGTGLGIVTGTNNTIVGANVTGLASGLSGAIIIADGTGAIKLDYGKTTASVWTAAVRVRAPVLSTTGYTVATLPAGTLGDRAYVTDALSPAFLVTIAGSGAVKTPVFYDGTNWVGG